MFLLSCARVRMNTGCEMSAHKKTYLECTQIFPPKRFFAHIHTYLSFQIQTSSGKILHKINFMHTQILKN